MQETAGRARLKNTFFILDSCRQNKAGRSARNRKRIQNKAEQNKGSNKTGLKNQDLNTK